MKKNFFGEDKATSLPIWAQRGNFRYARIDGGPALIVWSSLGGDVGYLYRPEPVYACVNCYSKENIRKIVKSLKRAYVNWIWVTWSTGFSLQSEEIQRKLAKQLIDEAHENGMKVSSYMSLTIIQKYDMFRNEPSSVNWVQRDEKNEFILYSKASSESLLACLNNKNWQNYVTKRIDLAIAAGIDALYFDNIFYSCHCEICQKKFGKHTKNLLGEEYNIPDITEIVEEDDIVYARDLKTKKKEKGNIELLWEDFQHKVIARMLKDIKNYASRQKENILVYCNAHERPYINEVCDCILTEDTIEGGIRDDKLITNIGLLRYLFADGGENKPFKVEHGRRLDGQRRCNAILSEKSQKLAIAETSAFGGNFYIAPWGYFITSLLMGKKEVLSIWGAISKYNEFLDLNNQYYIDTYPMASILIVIDDIRKKQQLLNLIGRYNLMFEVVPVTQLRETSLFDYKLVVLPDVRRIRNKIVEAIKEYVSSGGNIITIDKSSIYDDYFIERDKLGLSQILGINSKEEKNKKVNKFGKGIAIYYPWKIEEIVESKENEFINDLKCWSEEPIINIRGCKTILANIMEKKECIIIHFLNYSHKEANDLKIEIFLDNLRVEKIDLLSPDGVEEKVKNIDYKKDYLSFSIPKILTYNIVVIRKKGKR